MKKNIHNTFYIFLVLVFGISTIGNAQSWENIGNSPLTTDHSNGYSYNGKAYVLEGGGSKAFWEYDPVSNAWTQLEDFPGASRGIAIGDDWNGKYYYGFGIGNSFLNDLWVFDPETMEFEQLPSCPCIGRSHPALIAHNDKIFMGAGSSENGDLKDWWVYDMITQEWTQKEDIPGTRRHHTFQFTIEDKVYVGGGHVSNWLEFDPVTDEWTLIDDTPQGRVAGTQFSYGDHGYLLAGDDRFHDHVPDEETFMRYDKDENLWEFLPELPDGSRWAPSSFLIDNFLYFFGGLDSDTGYDAAMWRFNMDELECGAPSNVKIVDLEENSAGILWTANMDSEADTLRWRAVGDTIWNVIPNPESVFVLEDLASCAEYEYELTSTCGDVTTSSGAKRFLTSGCGACLDEEYCNPTEGTNNLPSGFISNVTINGFENDSDENAYTQYTVTNNFSVAQGETFPMSVNVEETSQTVSVWIDYNGDGQLDLEEIAYRNDNAEGLEEFEVEVPQDAAVGITRMRVVFGLFFTDTPEACGDSFSYLYSEVEDYCLPIVEGVSSTYDFEANNIRVFPNPFDETITIAFDGIQSFESAQIVDINGRAVSFINNLNSKIDLSHLSTGVYFIILENEKASLRKKIVKL